MRIFHPPSSVKHSVSPMCACPPDLPIAGINSHITQQAKNETKQGTYRKKISLCVYTKGRKPIKKTGISMTKKNIRANNPLTVIAIFSMLTEASAAVSLPFIDSENQSMYVWFLITFPSFLIVFFFLTLNFNNQTLYSPSDFKNEEHFIKKNTTATHPSLDSTPEAHQTGEPPNSAYSSDTKYRVYIASSFVSPPHAKRHAFPAPTASSGAHRPVSQNKNSALSFLLTAHTNNVSVYLIDLNDPNIGLPPNNSLNDVLHYYCKKIRAQKKNTTKNCFILFLTNNRLNSIFCAYKNHAPPHKKNHLPENMTIMYYNTDTATLSTFLQTPLV